MSDERPHYEVADVVRAVGDVYQRTHVLSAAQKRVLNAIAICRTAALGGHVDECDDCGYERNSYNSCRDRHCPKCQGPQRVEWLSKRLKHLLPIPYFHVVFTIPDALNPLALRNKAVVYAILFEAASKTLLELASDPKRIGAQIGVTAVLHTWGQSLLLHPHLHCVVTGGGLSRDGTQWRAGHRRYLLPVKVLGKLFRGKFLARLEQAYQNGELELAGSTSELQDPVVWASLRDRLYRTNWVVYAKPPFGGVELVFRYLGNYSHRVAISNHRIVNFAEGKVTFTIKDYKNGAKRKTVTLDAVEFLRRFLLHVIPKGFHRIRHYGLYASCNVNNKLVIARRLLEPCTEPDESPQDTTTIVHSWDKRFLMLTGIDIMTCPRCGGRLLRKNALFPCTSEYPGRAPPVALRN